MACGLIFSSPTFAATSTWTGGSGAASGSGFWAVASNWAGLTLPVAGNDLVFPATAFTKVMTNNHAVTNYGSLRFESGAYSLAGSGFVLAGGILATNTTGTAGVNTLSIPLTLGAAQQFNTFRSTAGLTLELTGPLNLNGQNLDWGGNDIIRALGPISGAGVMTKSGSAEMLLNASNSFTDAFVVQGGRLRLNHPLSLGATNGGLVLTNAFVSLNPNLGFTNESLQLQSLANLVSEGGTNLWTGPVTISGFNIRLLANPNALLRFTGKVTGTDAVSMFGPGNFAFGGTDSNAFSGDITLSDGGTLFLDKPAGVTALQGRIRAVGGSTVRLLASEQIPATQTVNLTANSALDLNGFNQTLAFLGDDSASPGRVLLGTSGANALIVGNAVSTNFNGAINGSGSVVKVGASTWTLNGTNTHTGATVVGGGTLVVNGSISNSLVLVTNGLLAGTGTLARATLTSSSAILDPGNGTPGPARLNVASNLALVNGVLQLQLNGASAGTQHDQVRVGGAVQLTNATLNVTLGFTPASGTAFTIIDSLGAGAVAGEFAGLAEGSVLTVGATQLAISYRGGTGNDVVLTVTNVVVTGPSVWTGAAFPNTNWSNPTNWSGNTVPAVDRDLVFPGTALGQTNFNDLAASFTIRSLRFATGACSYRIASANPIQLSAGLTVANATAGPTFLAPLRLLADQVFANAAPATLNLAAIDTDVRQLTFDTDATVTVNGVISAGGSVRKLGSGALRLDATNTYAGSTLVENGSLLVNGQLANSPVLVSNGLLAGTGTVVRVTLNSGTAILDPGPGAPSPAQFNVASNLALLNGVLQLQLNGTAAGAQYDQVRVGGTVQLTNATLNVTLGFTPAAGAAFTVVDSLGAGAVAGQFAGLAEGAVLTLGATQLAITYRGGTGNDVVLVVTNVVVGGPRIWTGAGFPNTNWSNAANWSGNTVPTADSDLVFPGTALGKTNFNDLAVSVTFRSLRFATGAANYRIASANPIALSSGLTVNNAAAGPTFVAPLRLLADQTFANTTPATVTFGAIDTGGRQLTLDADAAVTVNGVISGAGSLRKRGVETLRLEAANAYTGVTLVEGGTLLVNGAQGASAVTINANSLLGGIGTVGALTALGGTVSPGIGNAPGLLNVNGDLNLNSAATYAVQINGTLVGSGYDELRVSGRVSLGGARLAMTTGYTPALADTVIIVRNDSTTPVTGTFAGLPQGATFTNGPNVWQIDYAGGDSNDVELTFMSQNLRTSVWDGGGADPNWLTAGNWVGDNAPRPGDILVFSANAAKLTNFNNFPAGTLLDNIRFVDNTNPLVSFNLVGNSLRLSAGIVSDETANVCNVGMDLTMSAAATFAAEAPSQLRISGAVDNGGFPLRLAGSSSIRLSGSIRGNGGLISSADFVQLSGSNSYVGPTLVSTGIVRVEAERALGRQGSLVTVEEFGRLQLIDSPDVSYPLILRGRLESLFVNDWHGSIAIEGSDALIRAGPAARLNVNGVISGSGGLSIAAASFQSGIIFNGSNTYVGPMRLLSGVLVVNGSQPRGDIVMDPDSALAGGGIVGSILASGGRIVPGTFAETRVFRANGDLRLNNRTQLEIAINGRGVGSNYSQLRVAGNVDLGNATLQVQQGAFAAATNDTFMIVRNDGANPVTGTFAGLPEGGLITNCAIYRISYRGGDGNDVVLTVTASSPPGPAVWAASGANVTWSNPLNWICAAPPRSGGDVIFATEALRSVSSNDFPAGLALRTMRIAGSVLASEFYRISGNSIALGGGIFADNLVGSNTLSLNLALTAPSVISNRPNSARLTVNGTVDNAGFPLTTLGGPVVLQGVISGSGGLNVEGGNLTLVANNTYTGPTRVRDGRLVVRGQQLASAITVGDAAGGAPTLSGSGRIGSVTCSGPATTRVLSPGDTTPAVLTLAGNLTTVDATTLRVRLNGTNAGTGYDQLRVEGNVALANCALEVVLGFASAAGDTFRILDNAGASPIAGTLTGLAEGATLIAGATTFRVSYRGGDGNDLVLTRVAGNVPIQLLPITSLPNGTMRIQATGQAGLSYTVEASTNLINWSAISTNAAAANGVMQFVDLDTPRIPYRFYRILLR